jgi:thioredoxin reductase
MFDVLIIGAGPAGLSAALLLGRCRRRVLVCDAGHPRNYAAQQMHGFLTRDGIAPAEFRRLARDELRRYDSVELRNIEVLDVGRRGEVFEASLGDGNRIRARIVLLATGQLDCLPQVEGAAEYYGKGVHHCPICDGWEHRDQPWVVYGHGRQSLEFALEMLCWTRTVVLCCDGPAQFDAAQRERLARNGIQLVEERLERLEGNGKQLERVSLVSGRTIPCRAFFFTTSNFQRSNLPLRLGCAFTPDGAVRSDGPAAADVPGVFVAGNVRPGLQMAIIAAAEGAEAGFHMNSVLLSADQSPG